MKALLLCFLLVTSPAWAGLDRYSDLVVSDREPRRQLPPRGVRVTYLGTNGYLLEARGATLLVDPYFSRVGLGRIALNLKLRPSADRLAAGMARLPKRIDAVLITHGHFDHLLDAPEIARRTGAKLIASPSSVLLAESAGLPRSRCLQVMPKHVVHAASAKVRVLSSAHDRILGWMPFPGSRTRRPPAPQRASDWVCGEPLAFLIEMGGQRIYVDSGGTPAVLPGEDLGAIDLAIVGVALPDSRKRLDRVLDRLSPRYLLPSHQDDFFRPLERGFVFGKSSDFGQVRRVSATRSQKLILLDYFRPWTLR